MPPYQQQINEAYGNKLPSPRSAVSVNADPPMEAKILVAFVMATCSLALVRSASSVDADGEVDPLYAVTVPLFEDMMSKLTLGWIRAFIALGIFATTYWRIFQIKGASLVVPYLKQSKLKKMPIQMDGMKSQAMFTLWCWNLLGLSFALNSAITILSCIPSENHTAVHEMFLHPTTARIAIYLFEIVAPCSMLVSFVVRYALWPAAKKNGTSHSLKGPIQLITHNVNIFSSLLEVGMLGRVPIQLKDMTIAPIYGCIYVYFTWFMIYRWIPPMPLNHKKKGQFNGYANSEDSVEKERNAQFVYFFFDTTLGKRIHCSVLLGLIAVLSVFYWLFSVVDDLMLYLGGAPLINFSVVMTLFSLVSRFRD